jgi:hypothetical protein
VKSWLPNVDARRSKGARTRSFREIDLAILVPQQHGDNGLTLGQVRVSDVHA